MYIQGFSTVYLRHIQEEMIKTIPGLGKCNYRKIMHTLIEYDAN